MCKEHSKPCLGDRLSASSNDHRRLSNISYKWCAGIAGLGAAVILPGASLPFIKESLAYFLEVSDLSVRASGAL